MQVQRARAEISARSWATDSGLWLVLVLTAAIYAPTLVHAAFLSDDISILGLVEGWDRQGGLWSNALALFFSRLPSGNYFYRPLPFLGFALDWAWFGAAARGWHLLNLVAHLLSTALVYGLAKCLLRTEGDRQVPTAVLAALLFALSPAGPEVVIWIAGRFDAMATAALLACLYCLCRSRNGRDRWAMLSWFAAILGVLSKESAAVVFPIACIFALWKTSQRHPFGSGAFLRELAQLCIPFVCLAALYFAARWTAFGSAWRVYEANIARDHFDPELVLRTGVLWFTAVFPETWGRRLLLVLLLLVALLGGYRMRLNTRLLRAWLVVAAALFVSLVLVLPHKSSLSATGEEGRFFYAGAAFLALLLALPTAALRGAGQRLRVPTLVVGYGVVTLTAIALGQAVQHWVVASQNARSLLPALAQAAEQLPPNAYALVVIPDHIGPVPFGRNAQGGLVAPPLQRVPLSTRLVPLLAVDAGRWYEWIRGGIVPRLRSLPLADVERSPLALHPAPIVAPSEFLPTHYSCWRSDTRQLVSLQGIEVANMSSWLDSWRRSLRAAGCDDLVEEIRLRVG